MSFKDRFFERLGLWPKRPEPIVKDESSTDPADRLEAAARTQDALREPPPPMIDATRPYQGVTTDDVDPRTGRLYPDYLDARKRREAARQAQAAGAPASIADWDISPK